MGASLDLWFEYILRFSHLVAGIAWIGSSFYFIWMDSVFEPLGAPQRNVDGEMFMVHGGFYYRVEKRKLAPGELPKTLHWFKWEATLTWITGIGLFFFLYYLRGASLLIDSRVVPLTQWQAIGLSLLAIIGSWLVYDLVIWNVRVVSSKKIATIFSAFFFTGLIYGLHTTFSGRGVFMITGVILGTMMLLNVWVRILPGQSKMFRDAEAGKVPDYSESMKSKMRSVHNTYFIFPVLFIMLSNHYPVIYSHSMNWLLLIVLGVSGALVRHAMVTKRPVERWTLLPASLGVFALIFMTSPSDSSVGALQGPPVDFGRVSSIVQSRCWNCHSSSNTDEIYKTAPNGIKFETEQQIRERADKIYLHVVIAKSMPLSNKTQMTDDERAVIARWLVEQGLVQKPGSG